MAVKIIICVFLVVGSWLNYKLFARKLIDNSSGFNPLNLSSEYVLELSYSERKELSEYMLDITGKKYTIDNRDYYPDETERLLKDITEDLDRIAKAERDFIEYTLDEIKQDSTTYIN